MKLNYLVVAWCAAGAIAAPAWTWNDDSIDKYFKAAGGNVYYCQSGWDFIHKNDAKYILVMDKGLAKRDHGRDHPEDDNKNKHGDKKDCDDHGDDSKCNTKRDHGKDDGPNHEKNDDNGHNGKGHDKNDDNGHDGKVRRDHGSDHLDDDKKNKHEHCDDHGDDSKCT